MKGAFVGEKNFDFIKMHGTTIKIQKTKFNFSKQKELSSPEIEKMQHSIEAKML